MVDARIAVIRNGPARRQIGAADDKATNVENGVLVEKKARPPRGVEFQHDNAPSNSRSLISQSGCRANGLNKKLMVNNPLRC